MRVAVRRAILPCALVLFAAWRILELWIEPAAGNTSALQPKDPVMKQDLPSAVSLPWSRPLFSKPVARQEAGASPPPLDEASQAPRLVGVIVDGGNRIALLELKGKLLRGRQGAAVGSWSIIDIEPRSVLAESRGSRRLFYLDQK
jgi:hypothetical protein